MKAVTFQALHTPLAFETLPDPTPDAGQVVVKVGRCGICGSDLHMTEDAAYGCQHGDVLGHELAGEVVTLPQGRSPVVRAVRPPGWRLRRICRYPPQPVHQAA